MLKTLAISKGVQLACACVCPVAGIGALAVAVPQVRHAIHKATAPRAYAKPKTRVRHPVQQAAQSCPPVTPIQVAPADVASLYGAPPVEVGSNVVALSSIPGIPAPRGGGGGGGGSPFPFVPGGPIGSPPITEVPTPGPGPGDVPDVPSIPTPVSGVPEVGTWLQMLLGFAGIGIGLRKGRNRLAGDKAAA
jgi:hypothetical protein